MSSSACNDLNDQFNQCDSYGKGTMPICLTNKGKKDKKKEELSTTDKQNLLRVFMNDMKKKLDFIDKTNWMFNKNFDIHFLDAVDPTLIDDHQNVFYIDLHGGI